MTGRTDASPAGAGRVALLEPPITALVSCIVPVFNGERYLRHALESILAQTYRPLEIIVVDDGSTDGSPDVAREFAQAVRYLRQPNAGPAAARNRGLGVARGEFVAFLDADDLWHVVKLARQMARFASRPELDACVTHARNFWDAEVHDEGERHQDDPRTAGVPGYITSALMARRALFDTVGAFDPTLVHTDDTDWFLRARDQGAVIEVLQEVLVHHRMHQGNLGHAQGEACRREYLRLLKRSLDHRRARPGPPSGPSPA